MMEEGVDQGVGRMARGGMHDQSGGLVEGQQVVVLVEDFQRDVFGASGGGLGLRPGEGDDFAGAGMMRGFGGAAIDADKALGEQALNGAAGSSGKLGAQKGVQPFRGSRLPDGDLAWRGQTGRWSSIFNPPPAFFEAGGAAAASGRKERRMSRPTPRQIALSATLKAGKPISSPPRRKR